MNVTFIARLIDEEGRQYHGEFEAPMDHEAAWAAARKAFPTVRRILTIYPEKQPYRLDWVWSNQS
jgi:hypothetical protein